MSRFWENLWNEISDPSANSGSGFQGVDDYEVDNQLIREMRLTYKGRDENGNRVWQDDQGHQYSAVQLQKKNRDQPGDSGTSSSNIDMSNDWKQYASGSYNPVNNFAREFYGASNPAIKHNTANPFVSLGSMPPVTNNSFTTQPHIEPQVLKEYKEEDEEDQNLKSYFYIVGEDNKRVDGPAKDFFRMLNDRAGGIFMHDPQTGEVFLIKGENPGSVPVTETTSSILAQTIMNGIQGGVGFNHATRKHKVYARVFDPVDNVNKNNKYFMEDFNSGLVDLSDYKNILNGPGDGRQAIIQAAFMGHFICERFALNNYETKKRFVSQQNFITNYHQKGIERECEILMEMTGLKFPKERNLYGDQHSDKEVFAIPFKRFAYPNNRSAALLIDIYAATDNTTGKIYWYYVTGGNIVH